MARRKAHVAVPGAEGVSHEQTLDARGLVRPLPAIGLVLPGSGSPGRFRSAEVLVGKEFHAFTCFSWTPARCGLWDARAPRERADGAYDAQERQRRPLRRAPPLLPVAKRVHADAQDL